VLLYATHGTGDRVLNKLEIYIFGLVFLRKDDVFGCLLVHTRCWPPVARGKAEDMFCLIIVLVILVRICRASNTDSLYGSM